MEAVGEMQNLNMMTRQIVRISLECAARTALPGSVVYVKVMIFASGAASGAAISASGVFVDLLDSEEVALKHFLTAWSEPLLVSHQAMNETFRIAPPFTLKADETRVFEGKFQLPINFQPTFAGRFSKHVWQIRARVETAEGDNGSDFQPFRVGAGS